VVVVVVVVIIVVHQREKDYTVRASKKEVEDMAGDSPSVTSMTWLYYLTSSPKYGNIYHQPLIDYEFELISTVFMVYPACWPNVPISLPMIDCFSGYLLLAPSTGNDHHPFSSR